MKAIWDEDNVSDVGFIEVASSDEGPSQAVFEHGARGIMNLPDADEQRRLCAGNIPDAYKNYDKEVIPNNKQRTKCTGKNLEDGHTPVDCFIQEKPMRLDLRTCSGTVTIAKMTSGRSFPLHASVADLWAHHRQWLLRCRLDHHAQDGLAALAIRCGVPSCLAGRRFNLEVKKRRPTGLSLAARAA